MQGTDDTASTSTGVANSAKLLPTFDNETEAVRARLLGELDPKTQYEALLAKNIIELEISYLISRDRVEGIQRATCRDIVWKTLVRLMTDVPLQEAELVARNAATAFARGETAAEQALSRYGLERSDIDAQAYRDNWALIREIDQVQSRFEMRRASLMADYRNVQASACRPTIQPVDDAEVT